MRYIRYIEKASREDKLAILREKWEVLSKKYGNLVETSDRNRDLIWKIILNADPTKNKQYLQWIITKGILKWSHKSFYLFKQDLPTLIASLLIYDKLKRTNKLRPEHKDINRIKDDDELFDIVNQYQEAAGRTKEQDESFFKNKAAKKLYESSTIEVVIPYTKEASCYFGVNTKWCTARNDKHNAFDTYNREGPLYIVTHKTTGKKYQLWFDTSGDEYHQFMDHKDNEIDWADLIEKQPKFVEELRKIFYKLAYAVKFIYLMNKIRYPDLIHWIYITEDYIEDIFKIIEGHLHLTKADIIDFLKRINFNHAVANKDIPMVLGVLFKNDSKYKLSLKEQEVVKTYWYEGYQAVYGDSK